MTSPKIAASSDYVLQHRDAPRTNKGGRVFGFALELRRPDEAGEGHEIDHGFGLSSKGFIVTPVASG